MTDAPLAERPTPPPDPHEARSKIRTVQYHSPRGWVQLQQLGGKGFRWDAPVEVPTQSYAPTLDEILEQRKSRGERLRQVMLINAELLEALEGCTSSLDHLCERYAFSPQAADQRALHTDRIGHARAAIAKARSPAAGRG